METLTNGELTVKVSSHGAELCSIMKEGREYLWQADPAFWKRHSPVLFPIVGSLWNGKCRFDGQEYEMSQHGFARDMDFTLLSLTDNEVRYRLVSDEETMARYPFPFVLEIGYRLDGNKVTVLWSVTNPGEKEMHFQIGAHPAFFYPDFDPETSGRGFFLLERRKNVGTGSCGPHDADPFADEKVRTLEYVLIKEKGCADPDMKYPLAALSEADIDAFPSETAANLRQQSAKGVIFPLDIHTFDKDALIFEDGQIGKVTLLTASSRPWLGLSFDAPLVGLWSPVAKNAPFVCIEPWYGRCDRAGYEGEFSGRDRVQHLAPARTFSAEYTIEIF